LRQNTYHTSLNVSTAPTPRAVAQQEDQDWA